MPPLAKFLEPPKPAAKGIDEAGIKAAFDVIIAKQTSRKQVKPSA